MPAVGTGSRLVRAPVLMRVDSLVNCIRLIQSKFEHNGRVWYGTGPVHGAAAAGPVPWRANQ